MGEWSDYFEDFPEENPANWINGRFDPKAAEAQRAAAGHLANEQRHLGETVQRVIADGNRRAAAAKAQKP